MTRGTSLLEAAHAVRARVPRWSCWLLSSTGAAPPRLMAAAEGLAFRAVLTAPDLGFPYEGA